MEGNCDVEMEEAEKLPDNCNNDLQESAGKVLVTNVEDEGGECVNKETNVALETEMQDQTNPKNDENSDSVSEYMNARSENKGQIGIKQNGISVAGSDENLENDASGNDQLQAQLSTNEAPPSQIGVPLEAPLDEDVEDAANQNENDLAIAAVEEETKTTHLNPFTDGDLKDPETPAKHESKDSSLPDQSVSATPKFLAINTFVGNGDHSSVCTEAMPLEEGGDGTAEDQAAFMMELESFYRQRSMDFKPPKFYGQPLNCLKLWRAVIKLGGYDRVTGAKLWRQVGESFHPPKTCTTVSWTFRIFYEKSLLEYEKHKIRIGELQFGEATLPEASGVDVEENGFQGSASGRTRRDAAARAMQGWHSQRHFGYGEVAEPVIKDKNASNIAKREKTLKNISSAKRKRPKEVEHFIKAACNETSRQSTTSVIDIGPAADWVKVNVFRAKDCFEVYALIPGLLREEVRVQSDPVGRLVITGQPEQIDNPWGIIAFKKVVNLPRRIDPLRTSAIVTLQGGLFVQVPFEQPDS